mgnify:CR=1 FL=1
MNYNQSKITEGLTRDLAQSKELISKIGEPQPHFRDGSVGKLHEIQVKATIHHQAYSGATNYHTHQKFDEYLARVVKAQFTTLANAAIELMQMDYEESMKKEEVFIRERLAQIESLKAQEVPA